jgi:hypothetical protein
MVKALFDTNILVDYLNAIPQVNGMLLVTRNTKDFPAGDPGVRAPYGTSH